MANLLTYCAGDPLQPIALIRTPFPDKFSIPRQPGLAPSVTARIEFTGDFDHLASIQGIEQHSHLWLLFEFNQHRDHGWRERVRPPRLGGNKSIGVFATRSPFRPNNIGLSVVKLVEVVREPEVALVVAGADLLDQTPIMDIKPYVPYVDCLPDARSEFAQAKPAPLSVHFTDQARLQLSEHQQLRPELGAVLVEVLSQDPRPAYHASKNPDKRYASRLYDLDVHWHVRDQQLWVTAITGDHD
ncbi:tRNA (N6-threonylcarbamoyladenosine(37)-N6)-methyltransferase TrmO [Idiomarina aquatica]|jgi:tRNA-Thr(GGU) m(6)t(6)A37 methyltransferase TsaA|uniref:tRNA (N6-threonylcarbamoyladenosine(37)-N6)-methyltransferase TrmO n=1 Tax=Idiomarina aquatica TaxID=1327752 RepID=A0AA94EG36_9GAMM|nr:tRNA (N6-threonylcarbamoyladenosine(37)-N6)-methyltransferase TrmO [Idiomarina aquatica]RUO44754.1 tRNA (N6-threonylcarbamoyladenosine(37)-N6)-methyltransferase TrmO [Idiomarina aquatica]